MTWLARFSNPWRPARLPASAGAGRDSREGRAQGAPCGAGDPLDEPGKYSLTYSEIGVGLCTCVNKGFITAEQAVEIGNQLFPIKEHES
jgi:hypothetical protein